MKAAHEFAPSKRDERAGRDTTARKAAALASAVLEPHGLSFDGFGNRSVLALLRLGCLQRQARNGQSHDPREEIP
jgi:hypothetical protein